MRSHSKWIINSQQFIIIASYGLFIKLSKKVLAMMFVSSSWFSSMVVVSIAGVVHLRHLSVVVCCVLLLMIHLQEKMMLIICLMMFLTFWYHLAFAIFSIKYWWIVDWSTVLVPLVLLDPSVPSVPLVSMVLVIPINSANRIIPLVQGPRFKAAWAMPKRAKTTSKVSRLVFILTKVILKDNWRENL